MTDAVLPAVACCASLAVFLGVMVRIAGRFWWADPRALVGLIGFLYTGTVPILHAVGLPVSVEGPGPIAAACTLQMLGLTAGLIWVRPPADERVIAAVFPSFPGTLAGSEAILKPEGLSPRKLGTWVPAASAVLVGAVMVLALARGGFSGTAFVRDERAGDFYTQDRLVLGMLLVGFVVFVARYWPALSRGSTYFVGVTLGGYVVTMLGMETGAKSFNWPCRHCWPRWCAVGGRSE